MKMKKLLILSVLMNFNVSSSTSNPSDSNCEETTNCEQSFIDKIQETLHNVPQKVDKTIMKGTSGAIIILLLIYLGWRFLSFIAVKVLEFWKNKCDEKNKKLNQSLVQSTVATVEKKPSEIIPIQEVPMFQNNNSNSINISQHNNK
jgi:hypothetical protein